MRMALKIRLMLSLLVVSIGTSSCAREPAIAVRELDWQLEGPDGRRVFAIVSSPEGTLYAAAGWGSRGDLYRLSNELQSKWTFAGLRNVMSVSFLGSTLYAGDNRGVYRHETGDDWTHMLDGFEAEALSLLEYDNTLFVGSDGVYAQRDGGQWQLMGLEDRQITRLAASDTTLYVVASTGRNPGLYRSTDSALSWTLANRDDPISALEVVGETIYAAPVLTRRAPGADEEATGTKILISHDRGDSWSSVALEAPALDISGFASIDGAVYAFGRGHISRSVDGGQSWSSVLTGHDVLTLATGPTGWHAGTRYGVLRSEDGGQSWSDANTGMADWISCLALSGDHLYAGVPNGLYRLDCEGGSWDLAWGTKEVGTCSLAVLDGRLFAAAGRQVAEVQEDGIRLVGSQLPGLVTLATLESALFAGIGFQQGPRKGGVFRLGDDQESWIASGLEGLYVKALVSSKDALYAGTRQNGIFRSQNGGTSWTPINTGLKHLAVFSLATYDSLLYAGISDAVYGPTSFTIGPKGFVFESADGGESWRDISWQGNYSQGLNHLAFPEQIDALACVGDELYIGAGSVFSLDPNSKSWTYLGLKDRRVNTLLIDGETIYAGTNQGTFRSQR